MWSEVPAIMPSAEWITSAANPVLKDIRKALAQGSLTPDGCCVVETFHLLEEALRSPCRVRTVIAAESVHNSLEDLIGTRPGIRRITVPDRLLNATAGVPASQGVIALVDPPEHQLEQILGPQCLVLIIDGIQDPGNLGTMIRSAEAFAASGLLLLKGSVSPFNSKAVRASAGSIFRVPFVQGLDEPAALKAVRQRQVNLYAAIPNRNTTADLTGACAIIIGSEGRGVGPTLRQAARDLSIPTAGVESLNAAVSAAILLYEARRQRSS